jgi:iron complex transport system permease protein
MNSRKREWLWILVAFVAIVLASLASISVGAVRVPFKDSLSWFLGAANELSDSQRVIIWELRLPRVLAAWVVGGALACAGVGFQGLFRNVLCDPYIIGASSGAALGVSIIIVTGIQTMFLGLGAIALAAMIGSILVVSLVFLVGALGRHASPLTLLLSGVAISSLANALVSLLMFLNDQKAIVILSWLMGSIAGSGWDSLLVSGGVATLGIAIVWSQSRAMDAYLLGDVTSQSLGLDLFRFRVWIILGASFATAAAVSMAGIVGFIGLIAPQIGRLLVGPRHGALIPMSFCLGAGIMLLADAISRTIVAPSELPVGVVTAMLGCPFFLALLLTRGSKRGML